MKMKQKGLEEADRGDGNTGAYDSNGNGNGIETVNVLHKAEMDAEGRERAELEGKGVEEGVKGDGEAEGVGELMG
ncbi:hypothetical protein ONS95_005151 [Cadophora gregata]|uniref:uncharacterized protein n=1 Tax=Cadophora gregata TaxID=51156 RepID=UPI0026DBA018|nr:uncharacterized protein ONS95_005151 [Cadophora gregata]KAK0104885.1 hypothetical protein ONS95_005151 [Cadophora gregata]KAK0115035.1 hypothetical protein ONS96_013505 [Cadophora gregata f. sp. sojae]